MPAAGGSDWVDSDVTLRERVLYTPKKGKTNTQKIQERNNVLSAPKVKIESILKLFAMQSRSPSTEHATWGSPLLTGVAVAANLGACSAPGNCHRILMC